MMEVVILLAINFKNLQKQPQILDSNIMIKHLKLWRKKEKSKKGVFLLV